MSRTTTLIRRLQNRRERWTLTTTPAVDTDLSCHLSETWNVAPQRFATLRGARRAARFYERELRMPLTFWIRRSDEVEQV